MRFYLILFFLFLLPFGLYWFYDLKNEKEKRGFFAWTKEPQTFWLALTGVGLVFMGIIIMAVLQNYIDQTVYQPPTGVDSGFVEN